MQVRRVDLSEVLDLDGEMFGVQLDSSDRAGAWWGVFDGRALVGYAGAKVFDRCGERGAVLTRSGVVPRYRGRGLQRRLIRARLRWAREEACPEAWTYTHFKNTSSANNLIRTGFTLWRPAHWGGIRTADPRWLYWRKVL